jgi:hypothetical protein
LWNPKAIKALSDVPLGESKVRIALVEVAALGPKNLNGTFDISGPYSSIRAFA